MTALLKAEGLHAAGKDAEQGQDDRNEDGVAVDDDGAGALAAVVFWCLPLLSCPCSGTPVSFRLSLLSTLL